MKITKIVAVLLALSLAAFSLCACKKSDSQVPSGDKEDSKTEKKTDDGDKSEDISEKESEDKDKETEDESKKSGVDLDMSVLSDTMAYAQAQIVSQSPQDYIGKVIKVKGKFGVSVGSAQNYYACLVGTDSTCCYVPIEFLWAGDHSYPADYPEQGADITVTGTFGTYKEGENEYIQLSDATLVF